MLLAFSVNYLILLVLFGYSFFFKKIIFRKKTKILIENLDILYGLTLLIFISLFLNFFFPLIIFKEIILLFGFLIFIYGFSKKVFDLNFLLYFFIIFFVTFVAFYNGMNIDSPMYHLQVIKWLTNHKISLGLTNLEIRLGFNSSWHSLVALLDLNIKDFSTKYYLSALILSFAIYEVIRLKIKTNYSDIFLFLVVTFLIFFSYLHPFENGVILNHLGNPERDIVSMIFFFLIIFCFLRSIEHSSDNNNNINLLSISIFLCVSSRFTMFPMILLLIYIWYKNRDYKIFNRLNIFLFLTSIIWLVRSFLLSGCLIFPISKSCFNTHWSTNINEVKFFVEEAIRISRTLPTRNGVNDLEFSLNSYDWIPQWINDYFLSAAILQIGSSIILISIILIIYFVIYKKKSLKSFLNFSDYIILFTLIFIISLWFLSAPETRYALGPIISLPCFFILITLKQIDIIKYLQFKDLKIAIVAGTVCILFLSKNYNKFQFQDLYIIGKVKHDYSHIIKLGNYSGENFYWGNFLCADFKEICVNTVKENYVIDKVLNYKIYKSDSWLKN